MHGAGSPFGGGPERIPVPKLNPGNSRLGRSRSRKPPGKVATTIGVLVILGMLAAVIAGFVGLTVELPYRAGWAGTPGTLSMVSCETVGSGRDEHTDCNGDFQAGSLAQLVPVSVEGDNNLPSDRTYSARLHSDGQTVSVVSGKTIAYVLGGMFATFAFVMFFGWLAVMAIIGTVIRRRGFVQWRLGKRAALVPLITAGVFVVFGVASGIVGAVQSF